MKQLLDPEAVITSLEIALSKPFDYSAAARRLNGSVSGIAPGTLNVKRNYGYYHFFQYLDGRQTSLCKSEDRVYELARRKYCELLLRALKQHANQINGDNFQKSNTIINLAAFIRLLAAADIDVARVVLTSKQYEWYIKPFKQKSIASEPALFTERGVRIRSKSEKDIGNELERFATPFHFEEMLRVDVREFVNQLAMMLHLQPRVGSLFHYSFGTCFWNVPRDLEWMNTPGSLWRTYEHSIGAITIYPDFRIMLSDGSLLFWEHEGLVDDFIYRNNASEREIIIRYAFDLPRSNLITTFERDTMNSIRVGEIIRNEILPKLFW